MKIKNIKLYLLLICLTCSFASCLDRYPENRLHAHGGGNQHSGGCKSAGDWYRLGIQEPGTLFGLPYLAAGYPDHPCI